MSPEELARGPVSNQDRLNTIVRSLKRLPDAELQRLGLDLSKHVVDGTEAAEKLLLAWRQRQAELKKAMESQLKPAEFMKQLFTTLSGDAQTSKDEKLKALKELESLVEDVDNARDMHTIGGWPILVSLLHESQPSEVRTMSAWVLGTAVKNNYDYQLWFLDPVKVAIHQQEVSTTALDMLADVLSFESKVSLSLPAGSPQHSQSQTLLKRAMYALSAAARGNMEVQAMLLSMEEMNDEVSSHPATDDYNGGFFLDAVYNIAAANGTVPDLMRKVWSFFADVLEERNYIREELAYAIPAADDGINYSPTPGTIDLDTLDLYDDLYQDGEQYELADRNDPNQQPTAQRGQQKEAELSMKELEEDLKVLLDQKLLGDYILEEPRWRATVVQTLRRFIPRLGDTDEKVCVDADCSDVKVELFARRDHIAAKATVYNCLLVVSDMVRMTAIPSKKPAENTDRSAPITAEFTTLLKPLLSQIEAHKGNSEYFDIVDITAIILENIESLEN